ncbi:type II secretion system GspH family protein [Laspinema sp. A4]|uniref:type IV pilus modification PilV family protein n=1 Tax=Laspinema sp. D2d TaxID=2953686 RepID=UPI0021BAF239|nr:type II secretion system protein [Laspinema sp. D2d]MCT7982827.1 type II secretion system GspH family protein [Laspinema sp. D2d]
MKHHKSTKPTEEGLTLIESLAAVIILAISVVAISPPIALSIATRVRAHRAQQAMQLAQGEIDRVRLFVENNDNTLGDNEALLPPDLGKIKRQDIPVSTPNPTNPCHENLSDAWCHVHLDDDGEWDMAIQRVRTFTPTIQGNRVAAFVMTVRVYTRGSIDSGNLQSPPSGTASLALSAATSQSRLPLAAFSVPIVKSETRNAFNQYEQFLNDINEGG